MIALIGDCGGTFSRFALLQDEVVTPIGKFRNAEFTTLPALILSLIVKADTLALCVAGVDNRERIDFTNCHFSADRQELLKLGFKTVLLMNDFVPLSIALSDLNALNITFLNNAAVEGNRLVIGVGTGLGVGALIKVGNKYMPLPTETGHSKIDVLTGLIDAPLHAEMLLSGEGFVRIYKALAVKEGFTRIPDHSPESLVEATKTDPLAQQAARLFWQGLANAAGSLALIFLTKGGVYFTGGMCNRLKSFLDQDTFIKAFIDKPPYESVLNSYPLGLIEAEDPAFIGLKSLLLHRNLFAFEE